MKVQVRSSRASLFVSTALSVCALGSSAFAQSAAGAPQAGSTGANQLEQVIVTATRQSSTVNRVALSVTANTQASLDQKGIRTIADLQGAVPGLRIGGQEGSGVTNIVIRGIRQQVGAATTGFYLDDTPLQKRNAAGFSSENGTPIPPLFDLDRVEVLRGPQGTLFGGGSEGGTVRYIQPQPSLTRYSVYARSQYSYTDGGDPTYEGGVAVGGPIVQDKLGFRASIFGRRSGGYIDIVDYRNSQVYDSNANSGTVYEGRVAMTWAPTVNSKITGSYFVSRDSTHNVNNTVDASIKGTLTAPSLCYNDFAIASLPLPSLSLLRSFLGQGVPGMVTPGAACPAAPGFYKAPGFTVGPITLSGNQSLAQGNAPSSTLLQIGSLDAQADIGHGLTVKSVTSYTQDNNRLVAPNSFQAQFVSYAVAGGINYTVPGQPTQNIASGIFYNPNLNGSALGGTNTLGAILRENTTNNRTGLTEELRISSDPQSRPVSFVAGLFYSNVRQTVTNQAGWNTGLLQQLTGMTTTQRYGIPDPGYFAYITETDRDTEIAGFGEATWHITNHLHLIGGVRFTRVTTDFSQANYGPNSNSNVPSVANGTQAVGSISATPITPKGELEYTFDNGNLLYGSASKGFRAGGVNQVLTSVGAGLAGLQYGFKISDFPKTYAPDTVWSYEVGGKFRLWDGKAQLNVSLFRIDWTNIQTNVAFGGDGVIFNAPAARSQGAELEGQIRPFDHLTLDGSVAYDEAKYTASSTFQSPTSTRPLQVVTNGNPLQVPKWTVDVGGRYDWDVGHGNNVYLRADFRWADAYFLNNPGDAAYTPDSSIVPAQKNLNLRVGLNIKHVDVNVFANNITDETAGARTGGRSSCTNTACTTFTNYTPFFTTAIPRPREVGVQFAYRY